MSKYTTGELAQRCGVSVRTVQYYDARKILTPSEWSEGGRRLYSEEDLNRLKLICFLREAGLSLGSIGKLLSQEDPGKVITVFLQQQEQILQKEVDERQKQLQTLQEIKRMFKEIRPFTLDSLGDIAQAAQNRKKLSGLRGILIAVGLLMDAIQVAVGVYWWQTGIWWPFVCGMCVVLMLGIGVSIYYFSRVAYICPSCHRVFQPGILHAFSLYHTPHTRKLTCPHCKQQGWCVEVWHESASS